MKLGELLGSYQTNLPVTPRHEEWLRDNANADYTELAKQFLASEVGKPQRDRTKTFSASGHGTCPRARQFSFLGMPPSHGFNTRTISIFHNGTWTHLRWQLAGLSAGWLKEAEVPVRDDELMLSGTLDGILDDDKTGLEIKSINSNGYNRVMTYGIKAEHKAQADAYLLMTELESFSFIYENKDTQDYREITHKRDDERLEDVRAQQQILANATQAKWLFPVKSACEDHEGREYMQCPFRGVCLSIRSWEQAEEMGCGSEETTKVDPKVKSRALRLRRTSSSPSD